MVKSRIKADFPCCNRFDLTRLKSHVAKNVVTSQVTVLNGDKKSTIATDPMRAGIS